jgi:hypothetical protein
MLPLALGGACYMSKTVRVQDAELIRALEGGAEVLVAGQRRFLVVQLDDSINDEPYNVTDPEEIALIRKALQDKRPLLSGEEARAYVKARLKDHGVS